MTRKKSKGQLPSNSLNTPFLQEGAVIARSAPRIGLGNRGRQMLEAMGYQDGDALGRDGRGEVAPLLLRFKGTTAGLGASLKKDKKNKIGKYQRPQAVRCVSFVKASTQFLRGAEWRDGGGVDKGKILERYSEGEVADVVSFSARANTNKQHELSADKKAAYSVAAGRGHHSPQIYTNVRHAIPENGMATTISPHVGVHNSGDGNNNKDRDNKSSAGYRTGLGSRACNSFVDESRPHNITAVQTRQPLQLSQVVCTFQLGNTIRKARNTGGDLTTEELGIKRQGLSSSIFADAIDEFSKLSVAQPTRASRIEGDIAMEDAPNRHEESIFAVINRSKGNASNVVPSFLSKLPKGKGLQSSCWA